MGTPQRPQTPQDRIISDTRSSPPAIVSSSPATFASPLEHCLSASATRHNDDTFSYSMHQNNSDETESLVAWYIDQLNRDPQGFKDSLTADELTRVLTKCHTALRHYRFQSALLRMENDETEKRNAVETNLIKKQVDFFLQSPLLPTPNAQHHQHQHQHQHDLIRQLPQPALSVPLTTYAPSPLSIDDLNSTPRSSVPLRHSRITRSKNRVDKNKEKEKCKDNSKLKLVEKLSIKNTSPSKRDFADHIKVFTLEKKI